MREAVDDVSGRSEGCEGVARRMDPEKGNQTLRKQALNQERRTLRINRLQWRLTKMVDHMAAKK